MKRSEETDSLIVRVAMADQSAFQALYDQTAETLFGICFRILRDQSDAESCLQDLYRAIWNEAQTFRGFGLTAMARLVTEVRVAAIVQKRARFSSPDKVDTRDLFSGPAKPRPEAEDPRSLRVALDLLQPARAILLRRVLLDGEGYTDLAAASEVDTATVRASLQAALQRVGQQVAPDRDVSITAVEYAFCLLPDAEAHAFEALLRENGDLASDVAFWQSRIAEFVIPEVEAVAPPPQLKRRIMSLVLGERRETLWQQIWPYALGGIVAALVLWAAVSTNVLLPLQ